jgi:hypothetical protein
MVRIDVADGQGIVGAPVEPVTAQEVRALLLGYEAALDAADSLPRFVRIPSRPRRWTLLEPLRRPPRLTVGTPTMVAYHVHRSTDALARRYARIAATRRLSEQERESAALVNSFRESLPDIHWRFIVLPVVVAMLLAVRLVLRGIPSDLSFLSLGFSPGLRLTDAQRTQLSDTLTHMTSGATLDATSVTGILDEIDKASAVELAVLAVALLGAVYLVFRPLSSAFRVKRLIFNMAASGAVDLHGTTTTWNNARSTGLYVLERGIFARLGGRSPNEIDLDLWISAAGAAFPIWFFVSRVVDDLRYYPNDRGLDVALLGIVVGLAAARGIWLLRTAAARRRVSEPLDPPAGFAAPYSHRLVETRSVLEIASLAGLSSVFQPLLLFIWIRLVRERRDLIWAQRRERGRAPRRPRRRGLFPALGSGILLVTIPPLPIALHFRQLVRLQDRRAGSARRSALWTLPLIAAAWGLLYFDTYAQDPLLSPTTVSWKGFSLLTYAVALSVTLGVVQREHNSIIRAIGTPLPYDDPARCLDGETSDPPNPSLTPQHRLLASTPPAASPSEDALLLHLPSHIRRPSDRSDPPTVAPHHADSRLASDRSGVASRYGGDVST